MDRNKKYKRKQNEFLEQSSKEASMYNPDAF